MQIFSISVFEYNGQYIDPTLLSTESDLTSFPDSIRISTRNLLLDISKMFVSRCPSEKKCELIALTYMDYLCYLFINQDDISVIMVCDSCYPRDLAKEIIRISLKRNLSDITYLLDDDSSVS
jgi:hypothetical protein